MPVVTEEPSWVEAHVSWLSMIIIFLLLSMLFITALLITHCLARRRAKNPGDNCQGSVPAPELRDSNKCTSAGASLQMLIAKVGYEFIDIGEHRECAVRKGRTSELHSDEEIRNHKAAKV